MNKRWLKLAAVPITFSFVAAACGSDSDTGSSSEDTTPAAETEGTDAPADGETMDFGGAEVTITGSERDDPSVIAINDALNAHFEPLNLKVVFAGDGDWESNINTQLQGGNAPDISYFPQPGKLAGFVDDGFVVPVSEAVNAAVAANWSPGLSDTVNFDGVQYGVPVKSDLKGIVFYKPGRFEADGYEVPTTYDEFLALVDTMAAAGGSKPLCVGIESGTATGWMFTDWVEDMMLRLHGGDVYDQWISNEVKFDDPRVIEAMQAVKDLWTEENVFAAGGTISATNFGAPVAEAHAADDCYMVRHSNFFAGLYPPGTAFADPANPDAVDVFYFPDINGDGPVLSAGNFAAAFNEDPATMAVMEYLATPEYAETRQQLQSAELEGSLSGFLSAAKGQDASVYQPLEQRFLEILSTADFVRFDGGDLMPGEVGSGTFWSAGTSLTNGDITAEEAGTLIQESWPT